MTEPSTIASKQAETSKNQIKLTPRQYSIVKLMTEGLDRRQIAEKLGLGAATVATHITSLYKQTGCSSIKGHDAKREELVRLFRQGRLVKKDGQSRRSIMAVQKPGDETESFFVEGSSQDVGREIKEMVNSRIEKINPIIIHGTDFDIKIMGDGLVELEFTMRFTRIRD